MTEEKSGFGMLAGFLIFMLIGALISGLAGMMTASFAFENIANQATARFNDYTLSCSNTYTPDSFQATLNNETVYCTLKERPVTEPGAPIYDNNGGILNG